MTAVEPTYKIEEIIDLQFLQDALDKFFDATKYVRIGLKNPEGQTLLKAYRPGPEVSPFCRLVRSSPEGLRMCAESDRDGVSLARETGGYCVYRCKAGLTDFAIPLHCDDTFVGALMSGQILLAPLTPEQEADVLARCAHLPVREEDLRESLRDINVISLESLEPILRLVALFGQNIIDRELNERRKTELYEERLRIAQEKQRAAELESALSMARFETLQAQINPHFLFNALNTVARLSILENAPKSEHMAYALSRLLRYSLSKIDQFVPLTEEIQQVATYLEIQKIRFQERLEYEIDCPASVARCLVPCMTLQPLVENALIHGLEPKLTSGKVSVKARRRGGIAHLEISDNGVGMPPHILEAIRQTTGDRTPHAQGAGIGLANVRQRLKHHYGDRMRFEITSEVDKGTLIQVQLPVSL
jgi:two-component system, LytTR family, sensor kinase